MIRRLVALAALGPLAAGLGGCSDGWFGDEEETILPGERVSVMLFDRALEADPGLAAQPLTLPEATANPEWPAPWVNPEHAPQHVAAGDGAEVLWRRDIGAGETDENVILSAPVVAQGRIFALDSLSRVVAVPLGGLSVSLSDDRPPGRARRVRTPQGHRSPRLKVIASKGRTLTGSSSFALAISNHCPSCSSNASRVRSVGSTSQRCATPSRA